MKSALLLLGILSFSTVSAEDKPAPSAPEIYEQFLVAVVKGDKETVMKLALPHKEISILFQPLTPLEVADAIARIQANPYRALRVGESYRISERRSMTVTKETEALGWTMVVSKGDTKPRGVRRTEDGWRVNVDDLIAERKAQVRLSK